MKEIERKWKRLTSFNKIRSFRLCPFQYILLLNVFGPDLIKMNRKCVILGSNEWR